MILYSDRDDHYSQRVRIVLAEKDIAAEIKEVSIEDVKLSKIDTRGVKKGKEYIVSFTKIDGDTYLTNDYSDEFKIVFNEGRLGLFLKELGGNSGEYSNLRGSLVQIRKKAIIKAHSHMNYQ